MQVSGPLAFSWGVSTGLGLKRAPDFKKLHATRTLPTLLKCVINLNTEITDAHKAGRE